MGYASDYATAILWRGREPMPPVDFAPNWPDAPRRAKYYPGVLTLPLADAVPAPEATVDAALSGPGEADEPFTLAQIASMLRYSYGLLGRRLAVQANTDLPALPSYSHANWHRGTASGGGLYPCSVYLVTGPGDEVPPGVYYYAHPHHALQRLVAGDVTGTVRAALDRGDETATRFLVVGIKYWQNAFKYNNFSYHAVTMDVGTVIGTWQLWAAAHGQRIDPVMWFDTTVLTDLLGLPDGEEGVFAVVPLRSTVDAPASPAVPTARVRHADVERSRVVLDFDALNAMHRTAAAGTPARPAPGALAPALAVPAADGHRVALPEPAPMAVPLADALRARRSSFGRFEAARPISAAQLSASLSACLAGRMRSEVRAPGEPPLTTLYVFVNHVDGVPAGSYEYDPAGPSLRRIGDRPPGEFLQRNYFLANYNLEQAAVVVVPAIRTHAVLDAVGDRGYNLVNAEIGAVAQNFYTSAAALSLGAGVALGFDNISYIEELGLDGTGQAPLLIMLLGHERALAGDYSYELV